MTDEIKGGIHNDSTSSTIRINRFFLLWFDRLFPALFTRFVYCTAQQFKPDAHSYSDREPDDCRKQRDDGKYWIHHDFRRSWRTNACGKYGRPDDFREYWRTDLHGELRPCPERIHPSGSGDIAGTIF